MVKINIPLFGYRKRRGIIKLWWLVVTLLVLCYALPRLIDIGSTLQSYDISYQQKMHFLMMESYGNVTLRPGETGCKLSNLKISADVINSFYSHQSKVPECGQNDPAARGIYSYKGRLVMTVEAETKLKIWRCYCRKIIRKTDESSQFGNWYECRDGTKFISDFTHLKCRTGFFSSYNAYLATVVGKPAKVNSIPIKNRDYNVMFLLIDSVSRLGFMRLLPNTFKLFQKLGGVVLKGYNIVGDGTPQALLPILTGKSEINLPNTRKRDLSDSNFLDVVPFMWQQFSAKGYTTLFSEDLFDTATFNYRLNGFSQQPTDHYSRPLFSMQSGLESEGCFADRLRYQVLFNYTMDFVQTYSGQKQFSFTHTNLCHEDILKLRIADDYLVDLFKSLQSNGHLKSTVVFLMADHGPRFSTKKSGFRNTEQGKLEERLPFVGILTDEPFKKAHPKAYKNLRQNAEDRLSTPFDIHATLNDLLNNKFSPRNEIDQSKKAISLFDEIPMERTCKDADIEPHWCACLNWEELHSTDKVAQLVARKFVAKVNKLLETVGSQCHAIHLHRVIKAKRFSPRKELLQFKKAKGLDGMVAEFSDDMNSSRILYLLKIITHPKNMIYEASVMWHPQNVTIETDLEQVSVLTSYGTHAKCVSHGKNMNLRFYCICK